ncbi:MAG: Type IV fimbrial biogenesis protein PilX [Olavius algarvensis Gamma 1 endosymbiont]|nr:MAG: Type IV fimbrial biogenesis protein PilX [Olavius algarvensis Gamma 1 endosymbiont]
MKKRYAAGRPGGMGGPPTSQTGAALVVGLIVLTALTLLSLSGMRNTRLQERMAGNLRDRSLAFQGAEAALRDAEAYLRQADLPRFDGSVPGLIDRRAGPGSTAYWSGYDWVHASRPAGAALPGLAGQPRYVIERLSADPAAGEGQASDPPRTPGFFRVTARATGSSGTAVVILQSTFGMTTGGGHGPGRRSWRQLR